MPQAKRAREPEDSDGKHRQYFLDVEPGETIVPGPIPDEPGEYLGRIDGFVGLAMEAERPQRTGNEPELDFMNMTLAEFEHETKVRTVGEPDGVPKFIPEFGFEVGTFRQLAEGQTSASLMHHVPYNLRGPYKPDQLACYSRDKRYRKDAEGYVLCYAKIKDGSRFCDKRAWHRSPYCQIHGGKLHPWDRAIGNVNQNVEGGNDKSRYRMFMDKEIGIEDLDDDELLHMGFRNANGTITKTKMIPREMVQTFKNEIFARSLDKLKVSSLAAANTLAHIMMDPTVDAPVRLRAATEILDRTVGKAPIAVKIDANPVFEQVFEGIAAISREESRAARQQAIDAEFTEGVEPEEL